MIKKWNKKNFIIFTVKVKLTKNNTFFNIISPENKLIAWNTTARLFDSLKKKSYDAVYSTAIQVADHLKKQNITDITISICGNEKYRMKRAIIEGLCYNNNFVIHEIIDTTTIPHNGVRFKKKMRKTQRK